MLGSGSTFRQCRSVGSALAGLAADALELDECDMEGANCAGLKCEEFIMRRCRAAATSFERADIKESVLESSGLTQANFRMAWLNLSRIAGCDLSSSNLDGANLFGATISDSKLMGVDLSTARIDGISFENVSLNLANLRKKAFRRYQLVGIDLSEADLTGCDFSEAVFVDCRLLSPVFGPDTKFDGADLRGATISNLRVDQASFRGAIFTPAQVETLMLERFGIIVADVL